MLLMYHSISSDACVVLTCLAMYILAHISKHIHILFSSNTVNEIGGLFKVFLIKR